MILVFSAVSFFSKSSVDASILARRSEIDSADLHGGQTNLNTESLPNRLNNMLLIQCICCCDTLLVLFSSLMMSVISFLCAIQSKKNGNKHLEHVRFKPCHFGPEQFELWHW